MNKNYFNFFLLLSLASSLSTHSTTVEETQNESQEKEEKSEARKLVDAAMKAYREGDYQKSNLLYEESLEESDIDDKLKGSVLHNLGFNYFTGKGKRDYETARDYFKEAEKLGNPRALFHLGHMSNHGHGVPHSPKLAIEYLEKCSQQTDDKTIAHEAKMDLALIYALGIGVPQDKGYACNVLDEIITLAKNKKLASSRLETAASVLFEKMCCTKPGFNSVRKNKQN